jgi:hypothetical protein
VESRELENSSFELSSVETLESEDIKSSESNDVVRVSTVVSSLDLDRDAGLLFDSSSFLSDNLFANQSKRGIKFKANLRVFACFFR